MSSVTGSVPPSLPRRVLGLFIVLSVPLLVVGCGGGSTYSVNEGRIAERFLPTERIVDHHPDSLQALAIAEGKRTFRYQLNRDYQSLLRKWSSRFRDAGSGRSGQSLTYATFWSLELSLASLQPEVGVLSLRKEKARELIEKRRRGYFKTIQIDVYRFLGRRSGSGIISRPSTRVKLQVGDRTYRPLRTDHGPLREAFVSGGNTVLYRRNTLHFPRTVEGDDILENASGIQLEVRNRERFVWQWGDDPSV